MSSAPSPPDPTAARGPRLRVVGTSGCRASISTRSLSGQQEVDAWLAALGDGDGE